VSFTADPPADPVQPPESGQGEQGGGAPYQEYLDRIPEEVRGQVEPVFRDWDGQVTQRFQDAAEFKRTWEPYEQLGVHQVAPNEVQWLMQFRDAYENNPQAIIEWASQYAQERGLPLGEQQAPMVEDPYADPYAAGTGGFDPAVLQEALAPLTQRLDSFEQRFAAQDQQAELYQAQSLLDEAMKAVPEDVNQDIFDSFLAAYGTPEFVEQFGSNRQLAAQRAVSGALNDYRKAQAFYEKNQLSGKLGQMGAPEGGGVANANPEAIKTLKDARGPTLDLLRQWRAQQQ